MRILLNLIDGIRLFGHNWHGLRLAESDSGFVLSDTPFLIPSLRPTSGSENHQDKK
jgi:hypothetical protein